MAKIKMKMLKPRVAMLKSGPSTLTTRTTRITGNTRQAINRRIMMRDNGLCQCAECKATGRLRIADEVDHVVPLWEGGAESDANRAAINAECHDVKTAAENKRRAGR
jgi:5-methylcytosine-specific restriction protein A